MDKAEFAASLDAAVDSERAQLDQLSSDPPAILYQYTDGAAVRAIATDSVIRATHSDFLNDALELRYASGVVAEYVESRLSADPDLGHVLNALANDLDDRISDVFLACFSEVSDSLGQWRAYASDGVGYSIGLDLRDVAPTSIDGFRGPLLLRVQYDRDAMGATVARGIGAMVSEYTSNKQNFTFPRREAVVLLATRVLRLTALYSLIFKMPGFKEESEWRLVLMGTFKLGGVPGDACFRDSPYGMAPFLKIQLPKPCPAREVWLGPKQDGRGVRSLRAFLDQAGLQTCAVRPSSVSYR
ncbi:MAG: DUF2971 domain-containing protein [Polyangiaceae bacterium]|nr:DUF2971 domain-containing protein [Polyangiaceae bacterium]